MTIFRHTGRFLGAIAFAGGALLARPSVESAGSAASAPALARAVERPEDAGRANDLGNQFQLEGNVAAAEAAYRRAIELDPALAAPHYNLGRLLLDEHHRFSARRALRRALELDPDHAAARFYLGVAEDELGFDRRARRSYRRAFELQPSLADPRQNPELGRRGNALHALIESWKSDPPPEVALAFESFDSPALASDKPIDLADPPHEPAAPGAEPSGAESGGGYARVTGGERTARDAGPADGGGQEDGSSAARRERSAAQRPSPPREVVIDASSLAGRSFVNQVVEPGSNERGRRPAGRSSKPTRGPGSRFNPPARPFVPDEESTGRIEPQLVPATGDRFAIGR